jgi:hypothetical protein
MILSEQWFRARNHCSDELALLRSQQSYFARKRTCMIGKHFAFLGMLPVFSARSLFFT